MIIAIAKYIAALVALLSFFQGSAQVSDSLIAFALPAE
jgi:hypothetical protein